MCIDRHIQRKHHSSKRRKMWISLIFLFQLLGIGIQMDVTLKASETDILVNSSVTLECSFSENTNKSYWYSSSNTSSRILIHNGECLALGFVAYDSKYSIGCQDNIFSLTILSVSLNDHGTSWQCHNRIIHSNIFTIHVIVPVKEVVLEGNTQVKENETSSYTCRSSYSLPPANILFFNGSSNMGIPILSSHTTKTIQSDGILKKATEVLKLTLTRYDNGRSIYCVASNLNRHTVSSNRLKMDITYPPGVPNITMVFLSGQNITVSERNSVIEGTSFNLTCASNGNPESKMLWKSEILHESRNDSILPFTSVNRTQTGHYTCSASNFLSVTTSTTEVYIDVLYPPDNPSVTVEYQSQTHEVVHDTLKVIEHTTTTLICSAVGNPTPQHYSWNTPLGTFVSTNGTLLLSTLLKSHKGRYSCTAGNYMQPSHPGVASNGSISTGIYIDILYRPSIDVITNASAIEGDNFTQACPLTEGNPTGASVEWIGMKSNFTYSRSLYLTIRNVTRDLDMYFMCKAYTTLTPTVGQNKTVSVSSQFHLNVIYEAMINSFYTNPSHTVLNANQTYEFICKVDSNPGATINIEMPNGEKFMERSNYRLKHNYTITSCLDIGRYTCTAVNENAKSHVNRSDKDLLVNCVPIPFYNPKIEVQSSLHSPATLTFITIAYPEPTCSLKIWNETSWSDISENTLQHSIVATSNISSSKTLHIFQCNLTITHFTKWKREEFQLRVKNVVGEYVQNFTLKPRAADDEPKSNSSAATIVGGLVGALIVVSTTLVTLWIIRKRIRGKPAKEIYQNVHLHAKGSVYDRVTPLQDRTVIEIKELTYESIAGSRNVEGIANRQDITVAKSNYDNPIYTNLEL